MIKKRFLIHCRHAPYGSGLARAAIDVALATSVFDQALSVLFSGDGVLQLLPEQQTDAIGEKNIEKMLQAFTLYDINDLFVDEYSLQQRGLRATQLAHQPRVLSTEKLAEFCDGFDVIFTF